MKPRSPEYFKYQGRSMWPCFQEGDLLELVPVFYEQIRLGDCIAYRDGCGRHVVHRVVAAGRELTTRGDAMPATDRQTVIAAQVLGRVVCRYRFGQPSRVRRGFPGRIAGVFYLYAGRIDPCRNSRGGRLAGLIRRNTARALKILRMSGQPERLLRQGEPDLLVWKIGGCIVGRKEATAAHWVLSWPWCFLLDPE